MKKIFFLLIVFWLPISCFEELVPARYFVGTIWGAFEMGGIYDDNNTLLYSYTNTHSLTLDESTFSHIIYRKEASVSGNSGYKDKDTVTMEGTYSLHYPNITLRYNDVERTGVIEFEVLTLNVDDGQSILLFLRKTSAEGN